MSPDTESTQTEERENAALGYSTQTESQKVIGLEDKKKNYSEYQKDKKKKIHKRAKKGKNPK